jgi:hypothetical protein
MYAISDLYMDVSYTVNFAYADVKQQTKTKPTEHQHSEIPLILLLKTFKSVLCDHTVYFHIVHHDNHEDTHMCSNHLTVNTWRCYDMVPMSMAWLDWWQKSCNICNLYMWKHSLRHYNFLYDIKLPHLSTRYLYFSKQNKNNKLI